MNEYSPFRANQCSSHCSSKKLLSVAGRGYFSDAELLLAGESTEHKDTQQWPHSKSVCPNTALNSYPYIHRKHSSNSSPEKIPFTANRGHHQRNSQLVKMHRINNMGYPTSAPDSECLYIATQYLRLRKHCERLGRKIVNGGGPGNLWLDSVSIFVRKVSP